MSENLLTFSDLELLLIGITGVLFIIQILYYLITYSRPLRAATAKSTERVTADTTRWLRSKTAEQALEKT